jgi:hypothetical protein
MHCAAANGHTATLKVLRAMGADTSAQSISGATPLRWAAVRGHAAAVRLLIHDAPATRLLPHDARSTRPPVPPLLRRNAGSIKALIRLLSGVSCPLTTRAAHVLPSHAPRTRHSRASTRRPVCDTVPNLLLIQRGVASTRNSRASTRRFCEMLPTPPRCRLSIKALLRLY